MFKIIPYRRELLNNFVYDGVEREFSGNQVIPIVEFYSGMGSCYIGIFDDKVLGVGGVYKLWEDAGGCFLFLNKEAQNYKKSVFKALLEYMNMLIKQYEISVLMVECQNDNLEANRLIHHLGFIKNRQVSMAVYGRKI